MWLYVATSNIATLLKMRILWYTPFSEPKKHLSPAVSSHTPAMTTGISDLPGDIQYLAVD